MRTITSLASLTLGSFVVASGALAPRAADAAPVRQVTKPPVVGGSTGPGADPPALMGQWFRRPDGTEEFRTHEFYDNIRFEGGGVAESAAIHGRLTNVVVGTAGITSFSIVATITNDLPGQGMADPGTNSHNEQHVLPATLEPQTMFNVKLTGEFAFSRQAPPPPQIQGMIASNIAPYTRPDYFGDLVRIEAVNDNQQAWYSFAGAGGYHVPTWDFGTIPVGASATQQLDFEFAAPLSPANPFFDQLSQWAQDGRDVLLNRSTDLKIGDWVDRLNMDPGGAYPLSSAGRAGNASVFFNVPEPSSVTLMSLGALALLARRTRRTTTAAAALALAAGTVALPSDVGAAPSREITSPPVVKGGNPLTGPPVDPPALMGQWFLDPATGGQEFRTHEFCDNILGQGGGFASAGAIRGNIVNVTRTGGPGSSINGFSILATITNDNPGSGQGLAGTNSHEERHPGGLPYLGTMFDVKLTGEFAFPGRVQVSQSALSAIASNTPPYSAPVYGGSNGQPLIIVARNEDQEAWFSYTDSGGFHVPTWDFGDIAPNASATRLMDFSIPFPMGTSHPLYDEFNRWTAEGTDVLLNRTSDLKIGDWVDLLAADSGAAYPVPPERSGNVSAFFNVPEPSVLMPLAALGLLARRRRRTA